jgi:release factor glutamine methyltransferase
MNLRQALATGSQLLRDFRLPSAELDAEVLLAHSISKDRTRLYAEDTLPLTVAQRRAFNELLARRASREPIAYLTGRREFFGLMLQVNRHVLIPRPETEVLVELALKRISEMGARRPQIIDVGTGSGAIAIAVAKSATREKQPRVTAVDISSDALTTARINARTHKVIQKISLRRSDLLSEVSGPFDLILANLPYLTNAQIAELPADIKEYEPMHALSGGADGLHWYEKLLRQLPRVSHEATIALFEIGPNLKSGFETLAHSILGADTRIDFHPDLAGRIRIAEVRKRA